MAEPIWRRRFGHPVWRGIVRGAVAIWVGALALILCWPATTTLVVFVLLTLPCHGPLSPFLPATFEPILLLYGQLYPPLVVALVGAVASAAGEYVNYYLYGALQGWDSAERIMRSGPARAIAALFARRPFLAIWVCAWSPLPDWAARILASHARYPVRRYLLAFVVGRIPKFWLLAATGMHWMPSGRLLWGAAGASVAVTLLGMRRRKVDAVTPSALPLLPVIGAPIPSSSLVR